MLVVEEGTKLASLSCRVCRAPVRAGESVLVAFRAGQPSLIHAHVCAAATHTQSRSSAARHGIR
jgi:hypothetical protein